MIFPWRDALRLKFKLQSPFWLVAELGRALYAKLRGFDLLVDAGAEERRLLECRCCPELDEETDQCKICTCWVPAKVTLAVAKCPKAKWLPVYVRKGLTISEK